MYAGVDPVTGRDRYLSKTVKGTDRPAWRLVNEALDRLQTQVADQRSAQTNVTLGGLTNPSPQMSAGCQWHEAPSSSRASKLAAGPDR